MYPRYVANADLDKRRWCRRPTPDAASRGASSQRSTPAGIVLVTQHSPNRFLHGSRGSSVFFFRDINRNLCHPRLPPLRYSVGTRSIATGEGAVTTTGANRVAKIPLSLGHGSRFARMPPPLSTSTLSGTARAPLGFKRMVLISWLTSRGIPWVAGARLRQLDPPDYRSDTYLQYGTGSQSKIFVTNFCQNKMAYFTRMKAECLRMRELYCSFSRFLEVLRP